MYQQSAMKSRKARRPSRAVSSSRSLTASASTNETSASFAISSNTGPKGKKEKKSGDYENQALEWLRESSTQRIETMEQMMNRLDAQNAQRELVQNKICDQIEDIFANFVDLDALDDAQREDAIGVKDDIILGIEHITRDAYDVQVAEFENNRKVLRAVGQARASHESDASSNQAVLKAAASLQRKEGKKGKAQSPKELNVSDDDSDGAEPVSRRPSVQKADVLPENDDSSDGESTKQADEMMQLWGGSDEENEGKKKHSKKQRRKAGNGPGEVAGEQTGTAGFDRGVWDDRRSVSPGQHNSDSSDSFKDARSQSSIDAQDIDIAVEDTDEEMVNEPGEETEPLEGETLEKLPKEDSPESGIQNWLQAQETPQPSVEGFDVRHDEPANAQDDYDGGDEDVTGFQKSSEAPPSPRTPTIVKKHPLAMAPPPPPRDFNGKTARKGKKPMPKSLASLTGYQPRASVTRKNLDLSRTSSRSRESTAVRWKRARAPQAAPEWKGRLSRTGSIKSRSRATSLVDRKPSLIPEESKSGEERQVKGKKKEQMVADKMKKEDEKNNLKYRPPQNVPNLKDELSEISSPDSGLVNSERPNVKSPPIVEPSPSIVQPWSSIMIEKVLTPEHPMKRLIHQAVPLPGEFARAIINWAKAQFLAWIHLFWFLATSLGRYSNQIGRFFFEPVQIICAHRGIRIEWPFAEPVIVEMPQESLANLATHGCALIILFFMEIYVAVARERVIWMQANSLTRTYMLDYVREDPSWRLLPGVNPKLMFGLGRVLTFVQNRLG